MLLIAALLLGCGGPSELSQPSDPPDPWPMSKAVLAASAAANGKKAPAAEEEEASPADEDEPAAVGGLDEGLPPEEAPAQEPATPPEAP